MWGGLLLSSQLVRPDTLPDRYLWQPGPSNLCWPVCGLSSQHLQQPGRPDCLQTMWKRFRVRGRSVFQCTLDGWLMREERLRWLTHSERRPQIFIPKRKSTSVVSSNWQHKFLYYHYKSVNKLDVLCRQNKIWTFGNPFQSKKLPICT